ncbi:MAG: AAA family ATPase [Candidatus Latescibacterota bacterium]
MYEDFYGLNEKPFSLTPDPKYLFLSPNHRSALEHLSYGIEQKEGFLLITGDIGTGKTTICRCLLDRLSAKTQTALVLNPMMSEEELLRTIISDFGITTSATTKKELIDELNRFLLDFATRGGTAVLIIDEAQALSLPVLEQVRILSNLETEKEKLLQIILVGQAELKEKLQLPKLRQLAQRISIRYHLTPLGQDDVPRYIEHRLIVAGSSGGVTFTESALKAVFQYSGGVPRLINLICDRALLGGYVNQTNQITAQLVKKGVESLGGEEEIPAPSRSFSKPKAILFALGFFVLGLLAARLYQNNIAGSFGSSRAPVTTTAPSGSTEGVRETRSGSENATPSLPVREDAQGTSPTYTIHVGSSVDEGPTTEMVRKLEDLGLGYEVHVSRVALPGKGTWLRVLMGEFETEAEAERVARELRVHRGFSHARAVSTSLAFGKGD